MIKKELAVPVGYCSLFRSFSRNKTTTAIMATATAARINRNGSTLIAGEAIAAGTAEGEGDGGASGVEVGKGTDGGVV